VCGDIVSVETLKVLANTNLMVFYVLGNAETDLEGLFALQNEYKNLTGYKNYGDFKLAKKNIAITHFPDKAKELAKSQKYDFIFYGHTHTPWVYKIGNTTVLNPGEIASHFGRQSTYAIVDLKSGNYNLRLISKT
jgi:putative phosphoesterase